MSIVRGIGASGPVHCSVTVDGPTITDLSLIGKEFDAEIERGLHSPTAPADVASDRPGISFFARNAVPRST